jgi:hypothetical protein
MFYHGQGVSPYPRPVRYSLCSKQSPTLIFIPPYYYSTIIVKSCYYVNLSTYVTVIKYALFSLLEITQPAVL